MAGRRLEMRRMAEAAEARQGDAAESPKKKSTRKAATTTRAKRATKEKVTARKRLVWVVFNGSMKEEARFPYDQLAEAEERLESLRQKSKKLYFLQPLKELIGDGATTVVATPTASLDDEEALREIEMEAAEEEDEELEEEEEVEEEEEEEEDEDDDSDE